MNCLIPQPSVLQGCNLAHVLGLFRITGAHTTAFALGARGALADMALWAIARLQTRLFASRTFAKCAYAPAPCSRGQEYNFDVCGSGGVCVLRENDGMPLPNAHASKLSSISLLLSSAK